MIKVKDNQTGEIQFLESDENLPQLVESGAVSIPQRDYEFQDGDKKYMVPAEGFLDAVKSGWKYRDQSIKREEELESKYGDSTAKALALGTARGLTFGLSDVALEKTGLMSEEELREIKNRNEGASTIGEIGGTVIPAMLSGGTSVAAKLSAKTLPGMIAQASTRQGARAAANVTSQVAKKAIEMGVSGAVEGAAYGLGNAISEAELGNAEFNAEAVLSNVGIGAVMGGGLGAAFGASGEYLKRTGKAGKKAIAEKIINQVDGDDAMKDAVRKRLSDVEAMDDAILALKDPEIEAIKKAYPDAPVTPGMESALRPVKNVENYLFDAPTLQGETIRKQAREISEYVEKQVDDIWKGARDASPEETGDLIRQTFFTKLNESHQKGKAFYDELMAEFGNAPVSDAHRTRLANIVKNSDAYRIGKDGADISRVMNIVEDKSAMLAKHADELEALGLNKRQIKELRKDGGITAKLNKELNEAGINLRDFNNTISRHAKELDGTKLTLKQIKELQSDIGASIKMSKGSERRLLRETYDQLRTMQDSIIRESVGDSKAAKKIIAGLDAANADYVRAYQTKDEIAELFGIKGADFDTVLEKLEKTSAIDLERKFLNIKKTDKAHYILVKYPEIGKLVLANRQATLIRKNINQGVINYAGIKKDLLRMTAEERALYFGGNKAQEKKLMDMLTLWEKRPKTLNPSGTDIRAELRDFLSPKKQVENWILGEIYKGNESFIGKMANRVMPNLMAIERAANSSKNRIASSVSGFFKATSLGVTLGSVKMISQKELDKTKEELLLVQSNPEELINRFVDNNQDLFEAAPQTANALQQRIIAGVQFLQTKTPYRDETYMGYKPEPSRSEVMIFSDYLEAVENPKTVLDQIKNGYVNPRAVEALKVVYPSMYSAIQAELISKMPKRLTRTQRIQLQPLIGAKVSPSMDRRSIDFLQGRSQQGQQAQAQANAETNNVPMTAALKMKSSERAKTGLSKTLTRT